VPLVVVGTGPAEHDLRALAERRGGDVEFTGRLEGSALHARVRASRAVVLPSEWYENAPVSVLEAYALGKPVVGARIGGIPELVREGETGACFQSGSADDLAATLGRVAAMPDSVVADLGRCARELVGREFTSQRYVERMLDVYASVGAPVR
jgi:glycosyltransferase involved in cell wall biosynthesis